MTIAPAIRHHDVAASDLASLSDALTEMRRGDYQGLLIRDLFDAAHMARVAERIDDAASYFAETDVTRLFLRAATTDTQGMIILGDSISRKTAEYFDHARSFRAGCARLFEGGSDFEQVLAETLAKVAGGRPVACPTNATGAPYGMATIRMVKPACHLLLHCGNFFYTWDSYDELRPMVDTGQQFSYFVVIREADAGGGLRVYDADFTDPSTPQLDNGMWDADAIERDCRSVVLEPRVGDMVLFDGGRYFHKVDTVHGDTSRLTIGGFLALSADHQRVWHWA